VVGELCKNGWSSQDAVWIVGTDRPRSHVLDGVQIPMRRGNFEGKGRSIVKYTDTLL